MKGIDYFVLIIFFLGLITTGIWAYFRKVKSSGDFFVAGGKLPWGLAGISHLESSRPMLEQLSSSSSTLLRNAAIKSLSELDEVVFLHY